MPQLHDIYLGLTTEEFAALAKRYAHFHDTCNDPNIEPVKVFTPISKKSLDELLLIREVSKDLEKKREEDMRKAAQVAEEPKEAEKIEEKAEEKKPETEK